MARRRKKIIIHTTVPPWTVDEVLIGNVVAAARDLLADCRDQGRDDCCDDLVDEMFVERLRKALRLLDEAKP